MDGIDGCGCAGRHVVRAAVGRKGVEGEAGGGLFHMNMDRIWPAKSKILSEIASSKQIRVSLNKEEIWTEASLPEQ